MRRFAGKVALVTGGRSGIGRAIARRLRDEGAKVFTAQRGEDGEFDGIEADFTDPQAPQRIMAELMAQAGRLDVLVNNAGMMQQAAIEETSFEDWQRSLAVNLTAPFLMIRAALPHLRKTRGSIVNTGSIEGLGANPGHAAYCASKAGLHGLDRFRAERRAHREYAGPGRIPTRYRPHSSCGTDRNRGGSGVSCGVPRCGRGELHNRTDLHRGWGTDGQVESSLSGLGDS